MVVGLLDKLHIYEERTGKYLNYFKHYDERIIVNVGLVQALSAKL